MSAEFIKPAGLEKLATAAGYGLVARANDLIFISGMTARDAEGKMVGIDDFEAQCVQSYENMKACVEAADGAMSDIILLRAARF